MQTTMLRRTLFFMLCIGLIALLLVFFSTFKPSEAAFAKLPIVNIQAVPNGGYSFVDDPLSEQRMPSRLMMVRKLDGQLRVFRVPFRDGQVGLPDIHWWQLGELCSKFEPDFIKGDIACRSDNIRKWASENYRWTLDGKNIIGYVDNMETVHGTEQSGQFAFSMTHYVQ
jgi:hypothetical protein